MSDYIVKSRLFHYYVEVPDELDTSKTKLAYAEAIHGQRISTDTADADSDPNVKYGLREPDENRGLRDGHFFSDAEVAAMEQGGLTDTIDLAPFPGMGYDPGAVGFVDAGHPLTVEQLSAEQMAELHDAGTLSDDDLLDAVKKSGDSEAMANKVHAALEINLGAEEAAQSDLASSVNELIGRGAPVGPEGGEGVEGSLPEGAEEEDENPKSPGSSTASGGSGNGDFASPAAASLAAENGLDADDIAGSGAGGSITAQDVRDEISRREAG